MLEGCKKRELSDSEERRESPFVFLSLPPLLPDELLDDPSERVGEAHGSLEGNGGESTHTELTFSHAPLDGLELKPRSDTGSVAFSANTEEFRALEDARN